MRYYAIPQLWKTEKRPSVRLLRQQELSGLRLAACAVALAVVSAELDRRETLVGCRVLRERSTHELGQTLAAKAVAAGAAAEGQLVCFVRLHDRAWAPQAGLQVFVDVTQRLFPCSQAFLGRQAFPGVPGCEEQDFSLSHELIYTGRALLIVLNFESVGSERRAHWAEVACDFRV